MASRRPFSPSERDAFQFNMELNADKDVVAPRPQRVLNSDGYVHIGRCPTYFKWLLDFEKAAYTALFLVLVPTPFLNPRRRPTYEALCSSSSRRKLSEIRMLHGRPPHLRPTYL